MALLEDGLPPDIIMLCCEWEMLLAEGLDSRDRLLSPEMDKCVSCTLVEGVVYGWDKALNTFDPRVTCVNITCACAENWKGFFEVDDIVY